jgi:N-acetylmuramoyl-L-alanine amidase
MNETRLMKKLLATLLIALLAGCATGPRLDTSLTAKGQASRVKFVVLHYTVADRPASLKILTEQQVSSHYLLTDDPQPVIYRLVDESQQAYHAGNSSWKNFTQLNPSSIGIEIVNRGWVDTPQGRVYAPFPQSQIDALIPLLQDIVKRHKVAPENILGHSDIAPQRKQDPGPMFPWYQLARAGLVVWPDAARVAALRPTYEQFLPQAGWYQVKLAAHGYAVARTDVFDEQTRAVLSAFQMKYRPAKIDGVADAETAALLEVLTGPVVPLAPVLIAPATTVPAPAASAPVAPAAPAVPVPAAPAALAAPVSPAAPAAFAAPTAAVAPAAPAAPVTPTTPPAGKPE